VRKIEEEEGESIGDVFTILIVRDALMNKK
jgi:hypothetical protein